MSKASEWVKKLESLREQHMACERDEVPRFFRESTGFGRQIPSAYVDHDGRVFMEDANGKWETYDALALAKWILDVFGEAAS